MSIQHAFDWPGTNFGPRGLVTCESFENRSRMQADGLCRNFAADRRGVTALEYGVLAGVLGLVLISIFAGLGGKLSALFAMLSGSL